MFFTKGVVIAGVAVTVLGGGGGTTAFAGGDVAAVFLTGALAIGA